MTSYLLQGGLVVTFDKSNTARVFKADVFVEGSTIVFVQENISALSEAAVKVIDCTGKWITPGFVDTHRHVWMSILKASQGDRLLAEFFVKAVLTVQPALTPAQVRIGQLAGCLEALHAGVTTLLDHCNALHTPEAADACLDATVQSGARVVWCPSRESAATQLFPAVAYAKEEETRTWQVEKLREWGARDGGRLSADGRVLLGLTYDIGDVGDAEPHQEVIEIARAIPVAAITAHVVTPTRIPAYHERGLLGPDVVLSHCTVLGAHTEPDDATWAMIKDSGAAVVSSPFNELGMGIGSPVAFQALERGVKCGLGADATAVTGPGLFTPMRTILQHNRARAHEREQKGEAPPPLHNKYTAQDAFRLATLGGAEALNLAHLVGTVEVGKKADLVVWDARSPALAGAHDPFQALVFLACSADVDTVLVDGEIVKERGRLTRVAWDEVARELQERSEEVRAMFPEAELEARWKEFYEKNFGGKGGQ